MRCGRSGGFRLTLGHLVTGLLLMLTIVGIPLGVANIKTAGLALAPSGKQIVSLNQARVMGARVVARVDDLEDG